MNTPRWEDCAQGSRHEFMPWSEPATDGKRDRRCMHCGRYEWYRVTYPSPTTTTVLLPDAHVVIW